MGNEAKALLDDCGSVLAGVFRHDFFDWSCSDCWKMTSCVMATLTRTAGARLDSASEVDLAWALRRSTLKGGHPTAAGLAGTLLAMRQSFVAS